MPESVGITSLSVGNGRFPVQGFIHTNDTTAAFRNLRLEQGMGLAGDDSSSSSSDDDELPLRRIPLVSPA